MSKLPLGALVRGYFIRRLHRTDRVENIKSAIKETLGLAINMHEQPPPLSMADIELHGRLIQQLDQSLNELHSVFFELPCNEQLRIIATDRDRMLKGSFSSRSSNSGRISSATERRQEMRRRSQQENLT
jgi:centrosomal protein CEP110